MTIKLASRILVIFMVLLLSTSCTAAPISALSTQTPTPTQAPTSTPTPANSSAPTAVPSPSAEVLPESPSPSVELKISTYPEPATHDKEVPQSINDVIDFAGRYDLRGVDLSGLSLTDLDLDVFMFDSQTLWPKHMPKGIDISTIKEYGVLPGLSIDELHKKGITGKGINVGIIDGRLLVDHQEFAQNIALYEEIGEMQGPAHYHGTPITSILCGDQAGVAPDVTVYYVAYIDSTTPPEEMLPNLAKAITRMVEINRSLPQEQKMQVVSISSGWNPEGEDAKAINQALDLAREEGLFVITALLYQTDEMHFEGVFRNPMSDPNRVESFILEDYRDIHDPAKEILMFPRDARWLASPTGTDERVMYSKGAWSMVIPYISGLYALACQVNPDMTPELFWQSGIATGYDFDSVAQYDGYHGKTVKLINPVGLIESLTKR